VAEPTTLNKSDQEQIDSFFGSSGRKDYNDVANFLKVIFTRSDAIGALPNYEEKRKEYLSTPNDKFVENFVNLNPDYKDKIVMPTSLYYDDIFKSAFRSFSSIFSTVPTNYKKDFFDYDINKITLAKKSYEPNKTSLIQDVSVEDARIPRLKSLMEASMKQREPEKDITGSTFMAPVFTTLFKLSSALKLPPTLLGSAAQLGLLAGAGYAINKLTPEETKRTISLLEDAVMETTSIGKLYKNSPFMQLFHLMRQGGEEFAKLIRDTALINPKFAEESEAEMNHYLKGSPDTSFWKHFMTGLPATLDDTSRESIARAGEFLVKSSSNFLRLEMIVSLGMLHSIDTGLVEVAAERHAYEMAKREQAIIDLGTKAIGPRVTGQKQVGYMGKGEYAAKAREAGTALYEQAYGSEVPNILSENIKGRMLRFFAKRQSIASEDLINRLANKVNRYRMAERVLRRQMMVEGKITPEQYKVKLAALKAATQKAYGEAMNYSVTARSTKDIEDDMISGLRAINNEVSGIKNDVSGLLRAKSAYHSVLKRTPVNEDITNMQKFIEEQMTSKEYQAIQEALQIISRRVGNMRTDLPLIQSANKRAIYDNALIALQGTVNELMNTDSRVSIESYGKIADNIISNFSKATTEIVDELLQQDSKDAVTKKEMLRSENPGDSETEIQIRLNEEGKITMQSDPINTDPDNAEKKISGVSQKIFNKSEVKSDELKDLSGTGTFLHTDKAYNPGTGEVTEIKDYGDFMTILSQKMTVEPKDVALHFVTLAKRFGYRTVFYHKALSAEGAWGFTHSKHDKDVIYAAFPDDITTIAHEYGHLVHRILYGVDPSTRVNLFLKMNIKSFWEN